jgi:hypothetical protein
MGGSGLTQKRENAEKRRGRRFAEGGGRVRQFNSTGSKGTKAKMLKR